MHTLYSNKQLYKSLQSNCYLCYNLYFKTKTSLNTSPNVIKVLINLQTFKV